MVTVEEYIGAKAGLVWNALNEKGLLSDREIAKTTKLSKEETLMALGWLAREGKVKIVGFKKKGRTNEIFFELNE